MHQWIQTANKKMPIWLMVRLCFQEGSDLRTNKLPIVRLSYSSLSIEYALLNISHHAAKFDNPNSKYSTKENVRKIQIDLNEEMSGHSNSRVQRNGIRHWKTQEKEDVVIILPLNHPLHWKTNLPCGVSSTTEPRTNNIIFNNSLTHLR